MDVSIVVVSYNTAALLKDCLRSIKDAQIKCAYEIIVVDNASTDGSAEMVARDYPAITLVRNDQNLRFAKANNQAIALSNVPYVLLLNSDTIMHRGTVDGLLTFMEAHPEAGAVGPKVVNPDGSLQSKGTSSPSCMQAVLQLCTASRSTRWAKILPNWLWHEDDVRRVGWVSGCCMMLRKSAVHQIGGLLESLFFYWEEVEWCYRASKAGYEVWYYPRVSITHLGGMSMTPAMSEAITSDEVRLRNVRVFIEATVGTFRGLLMSITILMVKSIKALLFLCQQQRRKTASAQLKEALAELKVMKCLLTRKP